MPTPKQDEQANRVFKAFERLADEIECYQHDVTMTANMGLLDEESFDGLCVDLRGLLDKTLQSILNVVNEQKEGRK